jgi:protein-tyrosine phosphatase
MTIGRNAVTLTRRRRSGVLRCDEDVIDLHSHLLPGIDDGPPDMDASIAMARAAVEGGVIEIVATPHVNSTYANDPVTFGDQVARLQVALDDEGIALRVHTGAEISHAVLTDLSGDQLRACTLGGGGYVLFEPPLGGPIPFIDRMVANLQEQGFKVLLAHPERIAAFHSRIGLVEKLVGRGCLTSVTAGSVTGQFGGTVKRFTEQLFGRGLVHNLASDAHDADWRSPALRPVLDKAVAELPDLDEWLDWLTVDVPRAVLAGEAAPGEPPRIAPPRRGVLGRLRRR